MPRPKPHYRLVVTNLQSKEQLRIELVPVGSKTTVLRQLRAWWVAH